MKSLDSFYNNFSHEQPFRIKVKLKNYADPFDCELMSGLINQSVDCRVGHFGYNFWFRTRYGVKGKKYSSYGALCRAIKLSARSKGLEVERIYYEKNN